MHRLVLLSFGLLFSVLLGCETPSDLQADPSTEGTSPAFLFGGGASVSLEKSTNGQDADDPPGPSITPGDPVVWEYRVTNTGAEALADVYVVDDREGFVCRIGVLEVGQEDVCTLEKPAQVGSYENLGTVYGYGLLSSVGASDRSHYTGEEPVSRVPDVQEIDIQIKPGDDRPCINASSKGRTPVALLSSSGFDALQVDPRSILAGGVTAPVRWGRGEDVNRDGLSDLVVHFQTQELAAAGLLQDGGELVISGETFGGVVFTGSDLIRLTKGLFCR